MLWFAVNTLAKWYNNFVHLLSLNATLLLVQQDEQADDEPMGGKNV
jgi:hypothetical protein